MTPRVTQARVFPPTATPPLSAWSPMRLGLAAALVAAALLAGTLSDPAIHSDTARDLLMARDCVDGGACLSRGPPSSVLDLRQGALWIHLLEAWRSLSLPVRFLPAATLLAALAGAFLVHRLSRRLVGGWAGIAAALWFGATIGAIGWPTIWNPIIAPLPAAWFAHASARSGASGRTASWLSASIALALCVESHLVSAAAIPGLLACVVSTAVRPVSALVAALGALASVFLASSGGTLSANLEMLRRAPALPAAVLATAALILGIAGIARRRVLRLSRRRRSGLALAIPAAAVVLTTCALSAAGARSFESRYLATTLPALVIGATALARRGARRMSRGSRPASRVLRVAAGCFAAVVAASSLGPPRAGGGAHEPARPFVQWTLSDAVQIAEQLGREGRSPRQLLIDVVARDASTLVPTIAAFLPRSGDSARSPRAPIILVKIPGRCEAAALAGGWRVTPLEGDWRLARRDVATRLDFARTTACLNAKGSDPAPRCVPLDLDAELWSASDPRGRAPYSSLAYPGFASLRRTFAGTPYPPQFTVELAIPIRAPARTEALAFTVLSPLSGKSKWRIEKPNSSTGRPGVPTEGDGPPLLSVVSAPWTAGDWRSHQWQPAIAETLEEDPLVRCGVFQDESPPDK